MSTGLRVGPGRRQHGVEGVAPSPRESAGERAAEIDQAVDRQHADAAAVGQDREALCPETGFCRPSVSAAAKSCVEIEHAQEAGAAEGGVVDGVRAGERAGVGRGRLRGLARGGPT